VVLHCRNYMGRKAINLTGEKINRLLIKKNSHKDKRGKYIWECLCDCGNICYVETGKLISGNTSSCGCYRKEILKGNNFNKKYADGFVNSTFYHVWSGMKGRCSSKSEINYNGRGIKVCEEWKKFENFKDDMYISFLRHTKEYGEKNTSIDRIDNNGNYTISNCRWATRVAQCNNRRSNKYLTYKGETKTYAEWDRQQGFKKGVVGGRINLE